MSHRRAKKLRKALREFGKGVGGKDRPHYQRLKKKEELRKWL